MESLNQLAPYLWRVRGYLIGSSIAALLVAIFWSAGLMLSYPLVKVLLQGQSLQAYLTEETQKAETETAQHQAEAARVQHQLDQLDPNVSSSEKISLLKSLDRAQRQLASSGWRLMFCTWLTKQLSTWLPEQAFPTLVLLLALLALVTLAKGLTVYLQENLVGIAVESTMVMLRQRMFQHVLRLDHVTLSLLGTPQLMARFTYDLQQLGTGLTLFGGRLVVEPLKILSVLICCFLVNWRLTTLSLIVVPLGALLFGRYGKKIKKASRKQMESMSRIFTQLEETLRSFRTILAFGLERQRRQSFHREQKVAFEKTMKILRMDALSSPTTEILATLGACMALLPGAYMVLRQKSEIFGIQLSEGPLDIAELALLYTLMGGLLDPARKLAAVYPKFKKSSAASDRVFGLLKTHTRLQQDRQWVPLPRHTDQIEFENITYTHPVAEERNQARPPALDRVSLKIAFGETVAIVGGNGSGKSTLVNLLPRLYDPDFGILRIDGIDIRHTQLALLRKQIAVVPQETQLFNRTISENLRYGSWDAPADQVTRLAHDFAVDSFASRFPDGLETSVGERGQRLSGGQRQRIALVRALLRDPAILILDEATSAIDRESETQIYEALAHHKQNRTVLIVTHSLTDTLLKIVDRVVVMDHGQIIAHGEHTQLLKTCPIYRNLFAAQREQAHAA
jgi:subfamily B ATP-binding cassette protein MsbA